MATVTVLPYHSIPPPSWQIIICGIPKSPSQAPADMRASTTTNQIQHRSRRPAVKLHILPTVPIVYSPSAVVWTICCCCRFDCSPPQLSVLARKLPPLTVTHLEPGQDSGYEREWDLNKQSKHVYYGNWTISFWPSNPDIPLIPFRESSSGSRAAAAASSWSECFYFANLQTSLSTLFQSLHLMSARGITWCWWISLSLVWNEPKWCRRENQIRHKLWKHPNLSLVYFRF